MKMTVDLPPGLVRQIKLGAVQEGRKLKDAVADLLRKGMAAEGGAVSKRGRRVKLPLVRCKHAADLTPETVSALLTQQEVEWHHETA